MAELQPWQNANNWAELRDKVNEIVTAVNKLKGGTVGQIPSKIDGEDFNFQLIDYIPLPTIDGDNPKNIVRVKSDGSGVEYYAPFSEYKSIPFQDSTVISSNSDNSFSTLRNSGSTVLEIMILDFLV
jgi:hypothetical protein